MSMVAKPYTFSANTSLSSSQMNANFDTLYNDYNGGIAAANLASNSVITAKIADSNVTTAKIADDAVTTAKILNDNVTTAKVLDGNITSPKLSTTVACSVYRSTAFNITGGSGVEKLILNATNFNIGSYYDTTTGTFTAPISGYYQISANILATDVATPGQIILQINANNVVTALNKSYSTAASDDLAVSASALAYCAAGSPIELWVDAANTEPLNVGSAGYNYMTIYFVGV